jgi:hypothetical protein
LAAQAATASAAIWLASASETFALGAHALGVGADGGEGEDGEGGSDEAHGVLLGRGTCAALR